MLTKGAIGNLINRYRAVLKKCHLINVFGSMPTPQNTWGEKRSHRWACTALLASVLLGGMLSTGYAAAINANVNENIGEALKNASDFSNAPFVVKNEHSYANEYTVELGNDLNFTTKIDLNKYGTPNWGDLDSSLGLINILSWNSKFDISGQQDSKEKPLITITHLPDDNGNLPTFTGDEQGSSNAPTNYAIVARGNSDRKYNTSLNFTNVNLNLNVVNGINAYMFGAVTVANSDCVTINAKKGDAFKRAISTVHSGNINIDSQNIHINVSGKNKNKDGEQFYYNTGLNTIDGGTIDLHATEELNIGVTTKNKINDIKVMNVGVHSYGNVDETDKIETYDNSNIILSGKSLGINVTRPDDSGYARAMWSVATNKNATISAEFDNIEIMSDNEGLATSITKENNNAVSSKIDLKATSGDIEITANSKAIYADIHSGISGVSLNAYNGSISLKSDGYAIENAVSDSTESSTIELKANEISILGNASKAIFSNVDENASRATASINIDGSNKLEIQTRNGSGLVAHGTGDGTINLNSNNGGTTILAGHLVSESDSKTNIGLNTNQSKWTGFAQDYRGVTDGAHKKGEINITAKDNATWYVKPVSGSYANGQDTKSYLTRWNSQGESNIDLRQVSKYQAVDIGTLTGNGTTFLLTTHIDGDRGEGQSTDQAIIHSGSGTHKIHVTSTGTANSDAQKDFLVLHKEENTATSTKIDAATGATSATGSNDLSFTLANTKNMTDQGIYMYRLATRDNQNPGEKGTEWYLQRVESLDPVNPNPPLSPTGEAEAALSGFAGHYAMWYGQLTDLRKRLGEVRYGTQEGLWVRGFADKARLDGLRGTGFTQHLYGGSIGYDTLAAVDEEYMWLVGMQIRSARAHQSVNGRWGGHGDLSSVGGGLYSTWAHADGWYVDAVGTIDWFNHKIRTTMLDGTKVHDDRSSYALGASLEAGRKFDFAFSNEGRDYWFLEPQLQLSYFWVKGGDYHASNGMKIEQKDMDSLTGRAGLVLGKKFALDDWNGSRYVQPYVKAGVNHEFLGEQEARINGVRMTSDLDGTRVYYGAGVDWQATDNLRLYMQAEREHGEHFTREYNISAGLKWKF